MSSLKGSYSHIEEMFINGDHDYDDELLQSEISFQPSESWEALFNEAGEDSYYFETKNFKNRDVFIDLRLLGYGRETEKDYYKLPLLSMYDSIFYIETTNATTPLFD